MAGHRDGSQVAPGTPNFHGQNEWKMDGKRMEHGWNISRSRARPWQKKQMFQENHGVSALAFPVWVTIAQTCWFLRHFTMRFLIWDTHQTSQRSKPRFRGDLQKLTNVFSSLCTLKHHEVSSFYPQKVYILHLIGGLEHDLYFSIYWE